MASIIALILQYRYLIVLPLAIIEGPVLALVCGFILRFGQFDLLPIFLCLMVGDFVSDIQWYYIGYYGGRPLVLRFGRFFSITEQQLAVAEKLYHRHYGWILFLSKITMGFGFAVAIVAVAGIVKIPFKKYMLVNVLSQPIWTGTLLAVGYFFGEFYLRFNNGLEILGFIAAVVVFLLLINGFIKYVKNEMMRRYG